VSEDPVVVKCLLRDTETNGLGALPLYWTRGFGMHHFDEVEGWLRWGADIPGGRGGEKARALLAKG